MKRGLVVFGMLFLLVSVSSVSAFSFSNSISEVGDFFSNIFGKITGHQVSDTKQGDFNGDGCVDDTMDFEIFSSHYNSVQGDDNYNSDADFNADGKIDFADFTTFGGLVEAAGTCTPTASGTNTTTTQNDSTTSESTSTTTSSESTSVESSGLDSTNEVSTSNLDETEAAKLTFSFVTDKVPGFAVTRGDLDFDNCVSSKDLELWYGLTQPIFSGGKIIEYRNPDTLTGLDLADLNMDSKIDDADRILLENNIGNCFEKDYCSQEFSDINDRNKCLIIFASNINHVYDFCGEGNDWDLTLCSADNTALCRALIHDPETGRTGYRYNEDNLKRICQQKYQLALEAEKVKRAKGTTSPSFKNSVSESERVSLI